MSNRVWISQVRTDSRIGSKQGLRAKFYDSGWEPAQFRIPTPSEAILDAEARHRKGLRLDREEMTEAIAIWEEARFSRVGDLFYAGPFLAVKGKLAGVLARFNLGDGALLPISVLKADLKTLVEGAFFLLNLGSQKDNLLPDESTGLTRLYVETKTGTQIWGARGDVKDGEIALRPDALLGADMWCERAIFNSIFMSDALVSALHVAEVKVDFRLNSCRIVKH